MLTVSKPIKAGQGDYYLSLASADDYYLSGQEPPGYWHGTGSIALGLSGNVNTDHFRNLLRGHSPDGERKLVRNADSERRAGYDLTWSAPKSVSVAWSQAEPSIRETIEQCLRDAAKAGIAYLQDVGGVSRRGLDGRIREPASLIFAAFMHSTSRAQDPQLHLHTVLLNVAVRPDGTTGSVEPREIYRHQMAAGALFRAELAALLEQRLGLRSRREGRAFELLGVDPDLVAFFSKRRAQIEAELSRRGESGARAAEAANFATRTAKASRPREELFAEWQRVGREFHWSTKDLGWLIGAKFRARQLEWERSAARTEALDQLTTQDSHFCARQIVRAVAECCQGRGLGQSDVLEISREILRSPELVRLGQHRGEIHYTTPEILELEQKILSTADAMREFVRPLPTRSIEMALSRHTELSEEQAAALHHLRITRGGLSLVHGMAGTGKSTLFAAAAELWAADHMVVHGAALSGKAARGLQQASGIDSTTIHRLTQRLDHGDIVLDRQTVVVLDEASMIGTRQLAKIIDRCAQAGASLVLCGDCGQLQAIGLGGIFRELTDRFPTAHLREIRRQRDAWAREAVTQFAAGYAEVALRKYLERGLVIEAESESSATDRLLEDWCRGGLSNLTSCVMLAGTMAEVRDLNMHAQAECRAAGMLGDIAVSAGPDSLFAGDRVLFTMNSMALGVFNGDLGDVTRIAGDAVSVRLDDGRQITLNAQRYPHLRLAYALTTHKAQGLTIDRSFVLTGGPMTDREMTYVQASRARDSTRWYLSEDIEETTKSMSRSHAKFAAIGLCQELVLVR